MKIFLFLLIGVSYCLGAHGVPALKTAGQGEESVYSIEDPKRKHPGDQLLKLRYTLVNWVEENNYYSTIDSGTQMIKMDWFQYNSLDPIYSSRAQAFMRNEDNILLQKYTYNGWQNGILEEHQILVSGVKGKIRLRSNKSLESSWQRDYKLESGQIIYTEEQLFLLVRELVLDSRRSEWHVRVVPTLSTQVENPTVTQWVILKQTNQKFSLANYDGIEVILVEATIKGKKGKASFWVSKEGTGRVIKAHLFDNSVYQLLKSKKIEEVH